MQSIPAELADRLDALKAAGVIAGWQDAGGPNYGLSKDPLPALIFPVSGGPASSHFSPVSLRAEIVALETFGPITRAFGVIA